MMMVQQKIKIIALIFFKVVQEWNIGFFSLFLAILICIL